MPSNATKCKRLGILTRVSTGHQVESDSPAVHEHRARSHAESVGAKVVEVYRLDAVSGKSTLEHPEIVRMLNDIRTGHITGVIISKLARLGRNVKELIEIADFFRAHSADLISLAERLDTSTAIGRVFFVIIAALAQWEREEIAARITAGKHTRAQMGRTVNGKSSIGYHWVDKKLVPNPKEVRLRVLIYTLFAKYKRFRKVAREVSEKGYRMRNGKRFDGPKIKSLIMDPTAAGRHRSCFNYTEGKKRMLRPESEWVWNPVKPIVSKRLWQYCNDLVHKNARPKRQLGRQSNFAFGNLVWCECGAKMYVNSGCRNWFKCARCGNKLHLQGLENTFVAEVVKAFGTAENISKQLGTAVNVSESQKISLKRIDKEISKLDSKLDKLLDLYTDAKLSKESYGQRAKAYEADLARLRKEKATLEKAIAKEVKNLPSPTEIAEEIKSLSSCWAGLSIVERQEVVAGIIDKVEVQKETIAFSFHESPSLIEITKKLRKLMVAQPFCDMRIVCDKPGKPPKKPHNNMCEPYVKFIEDRMRQGFTATEIRDQLQAELGFIVSMGPLSKITQRLKRSVFGIAQPLFPKPSLCDFHRTTIEQMVRQNWSAGQICEELKEKHNFRGTPRMVSRYMRALRLVIGVKLPTAQEKNPYWPYRDRIISKVKAGWKPMMILTSLEHEVGSVGSYRRFHAFVQWLRTSVLKGQTVKPMAGRLCVPHADFIAAAVSKGCSPPIILKRLKKERHFKGKLSTVRSFIASLKKTL